MKWLRGLALCAVALAVLGGCHVPAHAQSAPRASWQYRAQLTHEARTVWGPEANVALFAALIHQESMWRPDAVSHVGARGLGQFMPATANDMNTRYPELRQLAQFSPMWSLKATVRYNREHYVALRPLVSTTPIPDCDRFAMMLSAYNGGRGWVNRDRNLTRGRGGNPDLWWNHVALNSNRAGWAFKENRDYPTKILKRWHPIYVRDGWPGVIVCP